MVGEVATVSSPSSRSEKWSWTSEVRATFSCAANILSNSLGEHPEGLWDAALAGEECTEGDTSGAVWGLARGLGIKMPADRGCRRGGTNDSCVENRISSALALGLGFGRAIGFFESCDSRLRGSCLNSCFSFVGGLLMGPCHTSLSEGRSRSTGAFWDAFLHGLVAWICTSASGAAAVGASCCGASAWATGATGATGAAALAQGLVGARLTAGPMGAVGAVGLLCWSADVVRHRSSAIALP